jgi:ribosomal protein S18 acetylase RimI-like enzyme
MRPYPLLEELNLNAWPSRHRMLFDGWVLNIDDGFSRRASMIHPLYPSTLPLADKIAHCEAVYARFGRETVFSVTSLAEPPELDSILAERGYTYAALTSVQVVPLEPGSPVPDPEVLLVEELEGPLLADMHRLTDTPPTLQPTASDILSRISPLHTYAALRQAGHTIGMGLAVFERGWVGLFSIVVEYEQRDRGFGRRIMHSLMAWGHQQGATQAHLAVMCDNAPALSLYDKLGFRESYRYWFRYKRPSI